MMLRAYPLDWPPSQPRTERLNIGAPYACKDTLGTASDRIDRALDLSGFGAVVLSTDIVTRGRQYATEKMASDHGAALAFEFQGRRYHVGQDAWARPLHNVWSLALMAEGLRQTVRHAGDALFARMIAGFAALPPPPAGGVLAPIAAHQVLGVAPDAPREVIEAAYRALARKHHPDQGGSAAGMAALNAARDQLLREA